MQSAENSWSVGLLVWSGETRGLRLGRLCRETRKIAACTIIDETPPKRIAHTPSTLNNVFGSCHMPGTVSSLSFISPRFPVSLTVRPSGGWASDLQSIECVL